MFPPLFSLELVNFLVIFEFLLYILVLSFKYTQCSEKFVVLVLQFAYFLVEFPNVKLVLLDCLTGFLKFNLFTWH